MYCTYHLHHPLRPSTPKHDVDPWYVEFLKVDHPILMQLALAAQHLDIATLLDLVCRTIADTIAAQQTPENVREMLNLENGLTPQEVEAIKSQAPWAFDFNYYN